MFLITSCYYVYSIKSPIVREAWPTDKEVRVDCKKSQAQI